ncbi:MAG: N-acetylmuramoyl-L-alanine amidase [Bryobacteraceae bacterium]|nr:N-acetylmuramoyl-L-alanine amidase [Bryobacteraceae bacterium]
MNEYKVRSGDTLSIICRRFGIPLHLLIEVNSITDPNRIKVGQMLKIPSVTTDSSELSDNEAVPPRPPTTAPIVIDQRTFRLPQSGFIPEEHRKDLIVLHFTAGMSARSAYNTWVAASARVATAYILDVDGKIYELFDPSYWAYHLGIKGADSANHLHDKRSIGIEIVNPGPLKPNAAGELCWWYPANRFSTVWCTTAQTDRYVKSAYRGFNYYAAYTEAQIQALTPLILTLRERFAIPKRLPSMAKRTVAEPGGYFKTFAGIASHQNFRADKFDVGPAFPWERITL